jgi:hypothetical protein
MRFGTQEPGSSSPVELSPRSLFFFSSRAEASFLPWRLTIAENLKKKVASINASIKGTRLRRKKRKAR